MAVPDFQSIMRPLLEELADGEEHAVRDVTRRLATRFALSDADRDERLDGGRKAKPHENKNPDDESLEEQTPQEVLEAAFEQLRVALADELLEKLSSCSQYFFEKVVVQLLLAMGYGGVGGQGIVTPRTGDRGIDGVIHEDKLGLDVVCVQAKRWEGAVGREKVQAFVGSMDYYRARKGVIITTSHFTADAQSFVDHIQGKKVVLIDGERPAQLMIDHEVGVTPSKRYQLYDVSQDFFDEEEA